MRDGVARGVEPLAAATVTAPAFEMQALRVVADEQIVALGLIADGRIGVAALHMGLAAGMKIGLVARDAATGQDNSMTGPCSARARCAAAGDGNFWCELTLQHGVSSQSGGCKTG